MTDPGAIRRAMLEGALYKAKDAVHADQIHDFHYALQAYGDSCAALARVMDRTEKDSADWLSMDSIRKKYIKRIYEIRETMSGISASYPQKR